MAFLLVPLLVAWWAYARVAQARKQAISIQTDRVFLLSLVNQLQHGERVEALEVLYKKLWGEKRGR